jgi:hypothetical protein
MMGKRIATETKKYLAFRLLSFGPLDALLAADTPTSGAPDILSIV